MEENKVAQKLMEIVWDEYREPHKNGTPSMATVFPWHGRAIVDRILQSPDLQVTLVEPMCKRYEVEHFLMGGKMHWRVNEILATKPYKSIVEAGYFGVDSDITGYIDRAEKAAKEYCAWLNSKEPK